MEGSVRERVQVSFHLLAITEYLNSLFIIQMLEGESKGRGTRCSISLFALQVCVLEGTYAHCVKGVYPSSLVPRLS